MFFLAHDGYLVYKLLPYGVVREVVPYLARRAQENRGAMKSAQIERELLGKEIRQRLLSVFGRWQAVNINKCLICNFYAFIPWLLSMSDIIYCNV